MRKLLNLNFCRLPTKHLKNRQGSLVGPDLPNNRTAEGSLSKFCSPRESYQLVPSKEVGQTAGQASKQASSDDQASKQPPKRPHQPLHRTSSISPILPFHRAIHPRMGLDRERERERERETRAIAIAKPTILQGEPRISQVFIAEMCPKSLQCNVRNSRCLAPTLALRIQSETGEAQTCAYSMRHKFNFEATAYPPASMKKVHYKLLIMWVNKYLRPNMPQRYNLSFFINTPINWSVLHLQH